MGTKEASEFTSLNTLLEIRENNYLGKDGADYCPDTVNAMIWAQEEKKNEAKMESSLAIEESQQCKDIPT